MANTKAKKAEQVINAPVSAKKKNSLWYNTKKNMPFVIFALPAFPVLFFIMYVLYMSVLAGIDTTYYEAAQIDGAGERSLRLMFCKQYRYRGC